MDLNDVLRHAVAAGASAVHLKVGQPPVLRTDGVLAPAADFGALGDAELQAVLDQVTCRFRVAGSSSTRAATSTSRARLQPAYTGCRAPRIGRPRSRPYREATRANSP